MPPDKERSTETDPGEGPITENLSGEGEGDDDGSQDMGAGIDIDETQDDDGRPIKAESDPVSALMRKKGLKSAADVAAYVENLERRNTELSQDVRRAQISQILPVNQPPTRQPGNGGIPDFELPEDAMELVSDKSKWAKFKETLRKRDEAIVSNVRREIDEENLNREKAVAMAEVQDLIAENPRLFQKLRTTMIDLSNNPRFARASVRQLYDSAKKIYDQSRKEDIEELKADLGLSGIPADQMRAGVPRANQIRLSQSSAAAGARGGQAQAPLTEKEKAIKAIKQGILASDKLQE